MSYVIAYGFACLTGTVGFAVGIIFGQRSVSRRAFGSKR